MSVELCLRAFVIPVAARAKVRALAARAHQILVDHTDAPKRRRPSWADYEAAKSAYENACATHGRALPEFDLPRGDNLLLELFGAVARGVEMSCMGAAEQAVVVAGLASKGKRLPQNAERPKTARRLRKWLKEALAAADGQLLAIFFVDGFWSDSPDPPTAKEIRIRQETFDEVRRALKDLS